MRELEFHTPARLDEAVAILERHNGQARCLAGGTDLIAQLKERRRQASAIVDIKRIPDVNVLSYDPVVGLRIGAGVSCTTILKHQDVQANYSGLAYAGGRVGS